VKKALFQITTKYEAKELRAFKADIGAIKKIASELNVLASATTGMQAAGRNVQTFVAEVAKIDPRHSRTLHQIAMSMEYMRRSTKDLSGATGTLKGFGNVVLEIGKRVSKSTKAWPAGMEAIKQMAVVIRQLGTGGQGVPAILNLVGQVQADTRHGSILWSLMNLEFAVRPVQQILSAFQQIRGMKGGFGMPGVGGVGGGGAVGGATPGVYSFGDPEHQKWITRQTGEALKPGGATKRARDLGEAGEKFLTQYYKYERGSIEEMRHTYETIAKIENIKVEQFKTETEYLAFLKRRYAESYRGTVSATTVAGIATRGLKFGEITTGKGAAPIGAQGVRGTLVHKGVEKSMLGLGISKTTGALSPELVETIATGRFATDPQFAKDLETTGKFAGKEFEKYAKGAFGEGVTKQPWYQKELNTIRGSIKKSTLGILRELWKQAATAQKGNVRKGLQEMRLFVEKPFKPVQVIKAGAEPIAKRILPEFKGVMDPFLKNLQKGLGPSKWLEFEKATQKLGMSVTGIADYVGKIGAKGFVIDVKTAKQSLQNAKYFVKQVKELYARMGKRLFPEQGTQFQALIATAEGVVKDVDLIHKEAKTAKKAEGISARAITKGPYAERVGVERARREELEKENKIVAENKRLDEEAVRVKEKSLAIEREITNAKKQQNVEQTRLIGGGAGRIPPSGGGGVFGGRFSLRGTEGLVDPMTRYEREMNRATLESVAFGKSLDVADIKAKLITRSIRDMAGNMARIVALEKVRKKDPTFLRAEAYERLNNELREYATLQERVLEFRRKSGVILREAGVTVGGKRELEKRAGIDKKLATESEVREARRATTSLASFEKLEKQYGTSIKYTKEFRGAITEAMTSGGKGISGLTEKLHNMLKPLGLTGIKVKDADHAMKLLAKTSRELYMEVQNDRNAYNALNKELDKNKILIERVLGKSKMSKLSTVELAVANKMLQQYLSRISRELELVEGKLIEAEQAAKRDTVAIKRLGDQHRQLLARYKEFESKSKDVNKAFRLQRGSAEGLRGSLRTTLMGFRDMIKSQMMWVAGYGLMFGTLRKFKEALGSVIEMEHELARAMRTVRSEIQTNIQVYEGFRRVSVDTMLRLGVGIGEVAEVLYQLGSAGLTAEESMAALKSTMDAIVGTEADVTNYTKAVAATYNNFKDAIIHVISLQEKFKYINDLLVATFRDHQVEMDELTQGLKHLSAMGKESNLEFDEMVGILATLNDHLIKSGMAGRSVQSVLSRISRQGREFSDAFDIEIDMTQPMDFIKILKDINLRMREGKMSAEKVGLIFERLGLRGAKAFVILARYIGELEYNISTLRNTSEGAAEQMANIMTATPGAELRKTGQAIAELTRQIFGTYVELARVSAFLTNVSARAIRKNNIDMGETGNVIWDMTRAIITHGLAIIVLSKLFGFLSGTKALQGVVSAFKNWRVLLKSTNLILLTITVAIVVFTKYLWRSRDAMKKASDTARDSYNEYEVASNKVKNLITKHRILTDVIKRWGELDRSEKQSLMSRIDDLVDHYDREGIAHMKSIELLEKEIELIRIQRKEMEAIERVKLGRYIEDQLKATIGVIENAMKVMGRAESFKEMKEAGPRGMLRKGEKIAGMPIGFYPQLISMWLAGAKPEDVKKVQKELEQQWIILNEKLSKTRSIFKENSEEVRGLEGAINQVEVAIGTLARETGMKFRGIAKNINDVEQEINDATFRIGEFRKETENALKRIGASPEDIFVVKVFGKLREQVEKIRKERPNELIKNIIKEFMEFKPGVEKVISKGLESYLGRIAKDAMFKLEEQMKVSEERMKKYQPSVVREASIALLTTGGDIQRVEKRLKKVAQEIFKRYGLEVKINNLGKQGEKILDRTRQLITRIVNETAKIRAAGMPAGLPSEISRLREDAKAKIKTMKDTVEAQIKIVEDQVEKNYRLKAEGEVEIEKLRKLVSEREIAITEETQKKVALAIEKGNTKYERAIRKRTEELRKLSFQTIKYKDTEDKLVLAILESRIQQTKHTETIEDARRELTRLYKAYDPLIKEKERGKDVDEKLVKVLKEKIDLHNREIKDNEKFIEALKIILKLKEEEIIRTGEGEHTKRIQRMREEINTIEARKQKRIEELRILGKYNIEAEGRTLKQRFTGIGQSFFAGIAQETGTGGVAEMMQGLGGTATQGWVEAWQSTILPDEQAIIRVSEQIGNLTKQRDELLAKGLSSPEDVRRLNEINSELQKQNNELEKLTDPMERAKEAFKSFTKSFLEELQKQIIALYALAIAKRIAGFFMSSPSAPDTGAGSAYQGQFQGQYSSGEMSNVVANVPGQQTGGFIRGIRRGRDSVPILAQPGEYYIRKSAVDYYGRDLFRKYNSMEVPRYQSGGYVPSRNETINVSGTQSSSEQQTGNNYYFIQANDVDSFRRLLEANGETINDISMAGLYRDIDMDGPMSKTLGG